MMPREEIIKQLKPYFNVKDCLLYTSMGGIITPDPVGSQPIAYPMGIYSTSTPYINDGETAP